MSNMLLNMTIFLNFIVEKIDYENIISIEKIDDEGKIFKLHIIEDNPFPDHKLTTEEVTITSEDAIFEQIHTLIADKIHKGILQTNINKSNLIYFYRLVSVNGSIYKHSSFFLPPRRSH